MRKPRGFKYIFKGISAGLFLSIFYNFIDMGFLPLVSGLAGALVLVWFLTPLGGKNRPWLWGKRLAVALLLLKLADILGNATPLHLSAVYSGGMNLLCLGLLSGIVICIWRGAAAEMESRHYDGANPKPMRWFIALAGVWMVCGLVGLARSLLGRPDISYTVAIDTAGNALFWVAFILIMAIQLYVIYSACRIGPQLEYCGAEPVVHGHSAFKVICPALIATAVLLPVCLLAVAYPWNPQWRPAEKVTDPRAQQIQMELPERFGISKILMDQLSEGELLRLQNTLTAGVEEPRLVMAEDGSLSSFKREPGYQDGASGWDDKTGEKYSTCSNTLWQRCATAAMNDGTYRVILSFEWEPMPEGRWADYMIGTLRRGTNMSNLSTRLLIDRDGETFESTLAVTVKGNTFYAKIPVVKQGERLRGYVAFDVPREDAPVGPTQYSMEENVLLYKHQLAPWTYPFELDKDWRHLSQSATFECAPIYKIVDESLQPDTHGANTLAEYLSRDQ